MSEKTTDNKLPYTCTSAYDRNACKGCVCSTCILMSYGYITKSSLIAYYISGAPVDLVHAASTVIFLWLLSRPLLEKLERIKVKYGLIQESEKR